MEGKVLPVDFLPVMQLLKVLIGKKYYLNWCYETLCSCASRSCSEQSYKTGVEKQSQLNKASAAGSKSNICKISPNKYCRLAKHNFRSLLYKWPLSFKCKQAVTIQGILAINKILLRQYETLTVEPLSRLTRLATDQMHFLSCKGNVRGKVFKSLCHWLQTGVLKLGFCFCLTKHTS